MNMIQKILKANPIEDPAVLSRRERKKLNQRYAIIKAAQNLIEQNGYDQTSISEIAEATDISYGTFFNYFSTKDEMLLVIEQTEYEDLYEILQIRHGSAVKIRPVIEDIYYEWYSDDIRYSNVFLRMNEVLARVHEEPYISKPEMILYHLIEEGISRREFRKDVDPAATVMLMGGFVHSLVVSKHYELFETGMRTILDGIMR